MTNMQGGSIMENMQENMQKSQNTRTMPKYAKLHSLLADAVLPAVSIAKSVRKTFINPLQAGKSSHRYHPQRNLKAVAATVYGSGGPPCYSSALHAAGLAPFWAKRYHSLSLRFKYAMC
jgi:hypothetical protein